MMGREIDSRNAVETAIGLATERVPWEGKRAREAHRLVKTWMELLRERRARRQRAGDGE